MSIPCTVYIDEAGDLGANRGTNWFVLTAVVVDATEEPKIRTTLKNIKLKLNLQNIHFRTIKDFNRRCYIVQELSQNDFTYVNILFDTTQMDKAKMPTDVLAYNYICRYLIERVSWFMRDTDRRGKIVLSSRGTTRDAELIDYIANSSFHMKEIILRKFSPALSVSQHHSGTYCSLRMYVQHLCSFRMKLMDMGLSFHALHISLQTNFIDMMVLYEAMA